LLQKGGTASKRDLFVITVEGYYGYIYQVMIIRMKALFIFVLNLKILDLENTLVVEIQKGILLYSCHIARKFLNIALLLDSIIHNSVCTPAKLPCRRVVEG
jgi:hypothetical protein